MPARAPFTAGTRRRIGRDSLLRMLRMLRMLHMLLYLLSLLYLLYPLYLLYLLFLLYPGRHSSKHSGSDTT